MSPRSRTQRSKALALSLLASSSLVTAGPCDIYASGGTPCIAAHSTTRSLYSNFNGPLYQVIRGSDQRTTNISPLSSGGVANAQTQDSFCAGTTCLISTIYDQSGKNNHLTRAPRGGFAGPEADGTDNLASAIGAPVTLNGKKAYGVFISPGTGYRNNRVSGSAVKDQAEGMYAVIDGTHFNDGCCFDYGNAETNSLDTGNGHMEAIYFGTNTIWGKGTGNGPWIMADLENGLFSGANVKQNNGDPTITDRFLTSVVKGQPSNWAIRGGNAASGGLSTFWNGRRPDAAGYNPMSKEGAIILGIGGDNSISGQGTFYEGVMTSGFPSDATENKVQADIVAAKYAVTSLSSGPGFSVGSKVSLRGVTACCTDQFLAHTNDVVNLQAVLGSSATNLKQAATWVVRSGLANSGCLSFESVDKPGSFIRHNNFNLLLNANDGSKQLKEDATFCPETGLSGSGTTSLRSWGYPTRYFRHFAYVGHIASNGGVHDFDNANSFNADASWAISAPFA